jgi:hypothetical protein
LNKLKKFLGRIKKMRKIILLVFVFTIIILLITPTTTSINKPTIEKHKIDMEKLEDITNKNILKTSDKDYIDTIISKIKNKVLARTRYPFICLFLFQIFIPNYIYFKLWNLIGITPYIPAYLSYITYTLANDHCNCMWTDWFS